MTTSPSIVGSKGARHTVLNSDILWTIFNLNAENEDIEPRYRLIHIMSCSHVCTEWRQILLDSPLIWGKLMILYDWSMSQEWIEEILSRSKSAPLWIHAVVYGVQTYSEKSNEFFDCFMRILDRFWNRVERFTWLMGFGVEPMNENIWHIFQRPSPILKTFSMHHSISVPLFYMPQQYIFPINPSGTPLFGDSAPMLQHFTTNVIADMPHGEGWFRNLRSLALIGPLCGIKLRTLMEMLTHIPRLEKLTVDNTSSEAHSLGDNELDSNILCPTLSFPFLNSLSIDMPIYAIVYFITNTIIPAKGCGIRIRCTIHQLDYSLLDSGLIVALMDKLGAHLRLLLMEHIMCHRLYVMDAIQLKISLSGDLTFCCGDFISDNSCPSFEISVAWLGYRDTHDADAVLSSMYNTLKLPIRKGVQRLYISYTPNPWEDRRFLSYDLPFFQAFPSITYLTIDEFLPSFWAMFKDKCTSHQEEQQDPTVWKREFPFPRLQTITTKTFSIGNSPQTAPFPELCDFLGHCDIIGLDFPAVQIEIFPADAQLLSRFINDFPDVELRYWNALEGKYMKCRFGFDDFP